MLLRHYSDNNKDKIFTLLILGLSNPLTRFRWIHHLSPGRKYRSSRFISLSKKRKVFTIRLRLKGELIKGHLFSQCSYILYECTKRVSPDFISDGNLPLNKKLGSMNIGFYHLESNSADIRSQLNCSRFIPPKPKKLSVSVSRRNNEDRKFSRVDIREFFT